MAVKKIFWVDPYQTELKTIVNSVKENTITLIETIFFAFSGGQQSDDGTINGYKILSANKINNEIFYTLEPNNNIKVGDEVLVEINWSKRFILMRLHFAAELVLEIVNQSFNCPVKFGANISVDKARLDFYWPTNISEIFPIIENKFKKIVNDNLNVESNFIDIEKEIRYWKIEGFGSALCGGTHIKSTGEIGSIILKRKTQGKNKERIEIYLIS